MSPNSIPEQVSRIHANQTFCFSCSPSLACFTECCRMLELALSPYDLIQLRRATGLASQQLLDQLVIEECDAESVFPRFYLTMLDDGRDSCPFVSHEGCRIYPWRPGACRAYPLGRAVIFHGNYQEEHFVLVQETHCQGFAERQEHTLASFTRDQQLHVYNRYNDAVAQLIQHPKIRAGFSPDTHQRQLFSLALFNQDAFRHKIVAGDFADFPEKNITGLADEELLLASIPWLIQRFFG